MNGRMFLPPHTEFCIDVSKFCGSSIDIDEFRLRASEMSQGKTMHRCRRDTYDLYPRSVDSMLISLPLRLLLCSPGPELISRAREISGI